MARFRVATSLLSLAALGLLVVVLVTQDGGNPVELYEGQREDERVDDPPSGWVDVGSRSIHVGRSEDGSIVRVDVPSDARIRQVDDGYEIALPQALNRARYDERYSVPTGDHLRSSNLDTKANAERRLLKRFFESEVNPSSRKRGWSHVSDWMKASGAGDNNFPVHVVARAKRASVDIGDSDHSLESDASVGKAPHLEVYVHDNEKQDVQKKGAAVHNVEDDLQNLLKDSSRMEDNTSDSNDEVEPCDIGCQMSRIYGPIIGPGLAKYSDVYPEERKASFKHEASKQCGVKCVIAKLSAVLGGYLKAHPDSEQQSAKKYKSNSEQTAVKIKHPSGGEGADIHVPEGAVVKKTLRGYEIVLPHRSRDRFREADEAQKRINAEMRAASGHWYYSPHWPSRKGPYPLDGPPSGRTIPHSVVDVYSPRADPFWCMDKSDSRECGTDKWVRNRHHDYSLGWTDENGGVPTPPRNRNVQDPSVMEDGRDGGEALASAYQQRTSNRRYREGYHRRNAAHLQWSRLESDRQPSPARSMELLQEWKHNQELNDNARRKEGNGGEASVKAAPEISQLASRPNSNRAKDDSAYSDSHTSAVAAGVQAWLGAYDKHQVGASDRKNKSLRKSLPKDAALQQLTFAPSSRNRGADTWLSQYGGSPATTELTQVPAATVRQLRLESQGGKATTSYGGQLSEAERVQLRRAREAKEREVVLQRMRLHSVASEKHHIADELAGTGGRWLWRA